MSFVCPCGCALQLDIKQQHELAWISALSSSHNHGAQISPPVPARGAVSRPDPTEGVLCRYCGATYPLAEWVAQWCRKYNVPMPPCDACRLGNS